jgi:hypothetical protein
MSTGIDIKKKLAILNEGANVTTDANSIDFVGSGVNTSTVGNNVTVTIPGGSGTTTYYLNQTVTQAPYKEFSSVATAAAEQVVPLTVSAGATSVIAEFQTPTGVPNTTQIPGGLWGFFLHFNAGSVGQDWIIRPTVYKRDLGGIETLLFTPDPEIVTGMSTTTTMYVSDGVFPATTLLTTDRIVVRISVQNTTGVSQTVNFRTEGSQHYSVGLTTLNQVISGGSVTSVTGTAPIVSSGGTTPAISIPQATAIADGYLSSSDWSVFNAKQDAITLTTIGTSGAATLVGSTLNVPNYATSSSGVCGIANSSGVYTYYATLSLAITAAVSGQTVDLLTDITETGSVTLSTKAGVKINGNGYTYTLSVNDATNAITQAIESTLEIFNLKVVRTGRLGGSTGRVLVSNFYSNSALKCQNVLFENTYGEGVNYLGFIYGLNINTVGSCVVGDAGAYNCNFTSSGGYGFNNSASAKEVINCNITGSTYGILMTYGTVYSSMARTTSGNGIGATIVVDSTGVSSSGIGISTNNGNNCVGISTSGAGLSGLFKNSTGISTSGYGGGGTFYNCSLISSSNYALSTTSTVTMYNSYAESTSSPVTARANIYNSTVRCLWNNAGGSCTNSFVLGSHEVMNSFLEVTNASAYCITGYIGSTWKYSNNTYKGSTTAVNATNITQGITNTSDNQGNILM